MLTARVLTARLLGPVRFTCADQAVVLGNRKARAILALLALTESGEETRARIASLLWSTSDQNRAFGSLRRTLHELRGALETAGFAGLEAGPDTLRLPRDAVCSDTERLLRAIGAGSVPDIPPRANDGWMLADLDGLDPAFDDWLRETRDGYLTRVLDGLTAGFASGGLPDTQRARARVVLLLDPTHEEACRVAMRTAADAGEIAEALRHYDELYRLLDAEHDMEPSAETQALLARIKLGQPVAAVPAAPRGNPDPPPRVAILPFRSIGPDPVPSYVADGLMEDMVDMLASMREPVVISSNSTRGLRDRDLGLAEIRQLLGVRYVVSGTTRPAARGMRLSVELADTEDGSVLWRLTHEADPARPFDLHDTVAANIVQQLAPHVHRAELRRMHRVRPENLGAYHLAQRAREIIFDLDHATFDEALALLRQAIALEAGHPAAHVTLADWYSLRMGQGWSEDPRADRDALELAARTALRHDPTNALAMAMLGHQRTLTARDYTGALNYFDRALSLAPNDAAVLTLSAPTFAFMGDPAETIRRAERAMVLSPRDLFAFRIQHFRSIGHFYRGELEAAEHFGREALATNPNYTSNLRMLACILVECGKLPQARELAGRAMAIQPGFRVGPAVREYVSLDQQIRRRYRDNLLAAGLPE